MFLYKIFVEKHSEYAFFNSNLRYHSKNKLKDSKNIVYALAHDYIRYGDPTITKNEAKDKIATNMIDSEKFKEKIKINEALSKIKFKNIKI